MRALSALQACLLICSATVAFADSRTFVVANQPDGYGIDQCLANGDQCGSYAARAYCQSRDFAQASTYHRIDPAEVTSAVPASAETCSHSGCSEYVAITCQR
ncbi:hypothetical protein [Bradyrhizobium prioriisuperbiae]|uniref:hypothetical protein n=1 Tax=Bradyrhizobium prioriisuperbiae TaxID=2854389 RepID=UPI0028E499E4|nr:hypothetical protein [Bradyrhizobium prioritasuperba]